MVASFESSMRSRRRKSVTSRMSTRAPTAARFEQREGADEDRRVAPLDLLGDREPGGERGVDSVLVEPDLGQALARRVRVNTHPVQGADRVRAREADLGVAVEDDHTVRHARRVLELDLVAREREAALGDHPREAVEHLEVLAFERAGPATELERRLAGDEPDQGSLAPNGDALDPSPLGRAERLGL